MDFITSSYSLVGLLMLYVLILYFNVDNLFLNHVTTLLPLRKPLSNFVLSLILVLLVFSNGIQSFFIALVSVVVFILLAFFSFLSRKALYILIAVLFVVLPTSYSLGFKDFATHAATLLFFLLVLAIFKETHVKEVI